MKTRIKSLILKAVVMIVAVVTGDAAPLKPLNLEQTRGEVRVVLLRAGQVVSTNNQAQFVVTYVVEVPTKVAFSDLSFSGSNEITLIVNGRPVEFHGETSSSAMGFKELPRQSELIKPATKDGKEMLAQEVVFKDLKIEVKKLDVKLQFSWRKRQQVFDFKAVPLN